MACTTLAISPIDKGCNDSNAGIKAVYVIDYSAIAAITSTFADEGNTIPEEITNITLADASTNAFKKWELPQNTASATTTATKSIENQSFSIQTDLSLIFNKQDATKRIQMLAANYNDLAVIYKDNMNGLYYMGFDGPVTSSAYTAETGVSRLNDRNGYTLTLTEYSRFDPVPVTMTDASLAEIGII